MGLLLRCFKFPNPFQQQKTDDAGSENDGFLAQRVDSTEIGQDYRDHVGRLSHGIRIFYIERFGRRRSRRSDFPIKDLRCGPPRWKSQDGAYKKKAESNEAEKTDCLQSLLLHEVR